MAVRFSSFCLVLLVAALLLIVSATATESSSEMLRLRRERDAAATADVKAAPFFLGGLFPWGSKPSTSTSSGPKGPGIYCPKKGDLAIMYGSSSITNQGWTTTGGGGVATKASFNLLGGSVEFDVDFSKTKIGVNANIYTISPTFGGSSFYQSSYCDGQKKGNAWCVEMDWIESNGNCGGSTAFHTIPGTGFGCTAWGCAGQYLYNGRTSFHMKVDTDLNGVTTVTRDGKVVAINQNGTPNSQTWQTVKTAMQAKGAVIYSSQWVGWVPNINKACADSNGDLSNSAFTISNLRITAPVVQGPTPALC